MPLTHVRTFRVRHHECDAQGHVHPAVFMRYAQEAAFDASAAAGYDMKRYHEIDRLWLVREAEIEYLRPLSYGDSVQVKTWVVDFRRVRSVRAYEFRHAASDELVARAYADWVHMELSTGRPAKIPMAMKRAFFPEGPPPSAPPRERFPDLVPSTGAFRQDRRAEWRDIDPAGHVNNTVYISYIEEGGMQALAALGWPQSRIESEGFAVYTRSHRIEYRQPALLDDPLHIVTWFSAVHNSTVVRYSIITRPADGAQVARAKTVTILKDLATGVPAPLPEALATALAGVATASTDHTLRGRTDYE